jgi:hypothetical protein
MMFSSPAPPLMTVALGGHINGALQIKKLYIQEPVTKQNASVETFRLIGGVGMLVVCGWLGPHKEGDGLCVRLLVPAG